TINISHTPGTSDIFADFKKSVSLTRNLHNVDRYEVNISCPNTDEDIGKYLSRLTKILDAVYDEIEKGNKKQEVYLKVSPDLTEKDVEEIASIGGSFRINGYTTTNTTTEHPYKHHTMGKGGASGDAVYTKSLEVQRMFNDKLRCNTHARIIPCGGISNKLRLESRLLGNVNEIQIFTPLIYQGPRLLRELKE
ncbi:MAG: hypothetical protein AAB922_07195, partial [Patescibacteria group bacterium]